MAETKSKVLEITGKQIVDLLNEGVPRKEIQEKYKISGQKLSALVRKHKQDEKDEINGDPEEAIPASAFAKTMTSEREGCVRMTVEEFREYNIANGRSPTGRPLKMKTKMNTGELRVLLNLRGRGVSAAEMKKAAFEMHGVDEKDLYRLAVELCREEESELKDILKQLNIKVGGM